LIAEEGGACGVYALLDMFDRDEVQLFLRCVHSEEVLASFLVCPDACAHVPPIARESGGHSEAQLDHTWELLVRADGWCSYVSTALRLDGRIIKAKAGEREIDMSDEECRYSATFPEETSCSRLEPVDKRFVVVVQQLPLALGQIFDELRVGDLPVDLRCVAEYPGESSV
jgi:hypothetical protein